MEQEGQIRVGEAGSEAGAALEVLKLTLTRVLSDSGCEEVAAEAGQMGASLEWAADCELDVLGVRDGTQKEGRVGLAAWARD